MKPIDQTRLHSARMRNDENTFRMDDMRPRFDALRTRHEDGTAPRAVSAYQLFQTPAALAARMVALANPRPSLTWLEPSAGLGRILKPILETRPANVTACEIDADLSGELFREFTAVSLIQRDFLEVPHPREGGAGQIVKKLPGPPFFDRVVMNPPFHMRSDIAHIRHALGFLRNGGVLVGLCLATRHREEAIRPLCDHWETIPAGAFRAEGTNVETILFRITTNR